MALTSFTRESGSPKESPDCSSSKVGSIMLVILLATSRRRAPSLNVPQGSVFDFGACRPMLFPHFHVSISHFYFQFPCSLVYNYPYLTSRALLIILSNADKDARLTVGLPQQG